MKKKIKHFKGLNKPTRKIPMKKKIKRFKGKGGAIGYQFKCPGCGMLHGVYVQGKNVHLWKWNGDEVYPTFTPSIIVRWDEGMRNIKKICHSIITFGYIKFLDDSTHHLKGQSMKLIEF